MLATSLYEDPAAGLHEDALARLREHPALLGCSTLRRLSPRSSLGHQDPLAATRRAPWPAPRATEFSGHCTGSAAERRLGRAAARHHCLAGRTAGAPSGHLLPPTPGAPPPAGPGEPLAGLAPLQAGRVAVSPTAASGALRNANHRPCHRSGHTCRLRGVKAGEAQHPGCDGGGLGERLCAWRLQGRLLMKNTCAMTGQTSIPAAGRYRLDPGRCPVAFRTWLFGFATHCDERRAARPPRRIRAA